MKFLLLVHFTGLALLGTTALCEEKSDAILKEPIKKLAHLEEVALEPLEDEQESLETVPENEEEIQESVETLYEPKLFQVVDVSEDEDVNLGQMLGDLFGGDDNEQEENFNREGRAKKGVNDDGLQFTKDPEIISQYNGFIDAFLRQLASTMNENSDPLPILLRRNNKITGAPKNKRKGPASLDDDDDEDFPDEESKGAKRPKGGKGKNRNRRKNRIRHPKDLSSDVTIEGDEMEEKPLRREKREIAVDTAEESKVVTDEIEETEEVAEADILNEEESLREGRAFEEDYEDMEEDEELEEESALAEEDEKTLTEVNGKALSDAEGDEGRSDGNDLESRRAARRRRRKGGRRGKRRKGKCGKKCQRRRRRRMRIRRRNRLNKNRGKRSVGSAAVLSGLSLIRREGDVKVVQKENAQDIHASIEVGPVTLTAEKTFGEGEDGKQRKSEAVAPAVKGKIVINISKDGNASVKAFRIFRPKDVSVSGSLRLDQSKNDNRLMQNYLSQASPFVSRRMKAAADKVFGMTPAKVNKNNNNRKGPGNKKVKKNIARN